MSTHTDAGALLKLADEARKLLGTFYKTVDVMKSAWLSDSKNMNVWADDLRAVEDVMLFLETLRDQAASQGSAGGERLEVLSVDAPEGATHMRRPEYITAWLFDGVSTMPLWLIEKYRSQPLPEHRKGKWALAVDGEFWRWEDAERFGGMFVSIPTAAQAQTGCGDPSCKDPTCIYGRGGPYQVTLCDDGGWMVHDIGDVLCVAAQGDSEQKARAICAAMNAKPASHGTDESRLTRYAADPEIAGDDRQSMEAVPSKGIVTGGTASTPSVPSASSPAQAPGDSAAIECLRSIAEASDQEPREPDDADWRFRFLEAQRAAGCTLSSLPSATGSAQAGPDPLTRRERAEMIWAVLKSYMLDECSFDCAAVSPADEKNLINEIYNSIPNYSVPSATGSAQASPDDSPHYLGAIRLRLEELYIKSDDPREREQISDEVDWITDRIGARDPSPVPSAHQSAPSDSSSLPSGESDPSATMDFLGADTGDNAAPYGNSPREIQKRAMKARTSAISSTDRVTS